MKAAIDTLKVLKSQSLNNYKGESNGDQHQNVLKQKTLNYEEWTHKH